MRYRSIYGDSLQVLIGTAVATLCHDAFCTRLILVGHHAQMKLLTVCWRPSYRQAAVKRFATCLYGFERIAMYF